MRITAVSYLNTLPFIYGIEQLAHTLRIEPASTRLEGRHVEGGDVALAGGRIALSLRIPALCAEAARSAQTDIALIPVAAIPRLEGFSLDTALRTETDGGSVSSREGVFAPHIVTDYCIGAEGAVDTVVLLSDTPLENISTIHLDSHSRTSAQLVRILAREHWKINPRWQELADCHAMGRETLPCGEAMLAIGDKVFELTATHSYTYRYDLAQEWAAMTGGLPFVFAAWVACTPAGVSFAPELNRALAYGVEHVRESITDTVNRSRDFDFPTAYRYLTEHIKFRFDNPKRQALRLFWEKIISPG